MSYDDDRVRLPDGQTVTFSGTVNSAGWSQPNEAQILAGDPVLAEIIGQFGGKELDAQAALFSALHGGRRAR